MGILWKILRNFSKYLNPGLCMVQMEPHDKTWAHCCFLFLQSHYEHQIGVVFQVLTTIGVGIKTVYNYSSICFWTIAKNYYAPSS